MFQESFDEENFQGSDGRQTNETAVQQRELVSLVEQAEAHVIVLLLGLLLLLFLLGGLSSGSRCSTSSSWGSTSSGSGAHARPNVGDQGLEVSGLESLGEEARPVRLNLNTSSLEDGGDLLRSDGDVIVGEDEGSVDASKLRVGHLSRFDAVSARDLAQTENKQSLVEVNQAIKAWSKGSVDASKLRVG